MNAKQQLAMYVLGGVVVYATFLFMEREVSARAKTVYHFFADPVIAVVEGTKELSDEIVAADPIDAYPYGRNPDGSGRIPEQVATENLELLKAQYPWLFGWL